MTIGELWDKLAQYPDDTELYIGYIQGHQIEHLDFFLAETEDTTIKTIRLPQQIQS